MQIIVFRLEKDYYAISTEFVEEIIRDITVTKVPNSDNWIEGLINLRGNVVTLVNLAKLLERDIKLCYNDVIIINNDEEKLGIMVENVEEVINISEKDIQNINENENHGIVGIIESSDKIVNIINIESLLVKNEG